MYHPIVVDDDKVRCEACVNKQNVAKDNAEGSLKIIRQSKPDKQQRGKEWRYYGE